MDAPAYSVRRNAISFKTYDEDDLDPALPITAKHSQCMWLGF